MQIKNHISNAETFKIWNALIASGDVASIHQSLKNKELGFKDKLGDDALSPLHIAAIHNQPEVCELLISEGISPNVRESATGKTPLHFAAFFGHLAVAKLLIDHGASGGGKKATDILACLPMHYAALGEHQEMLFLLLKLGHLIDPLDVIQDAFGVATFSYLGNVLDILIHKRNFEMSDLFSSVGGISCIETNPRVRSTLYIGYHNENPWTPFHSAASIGDKKILEMLLHKFPHAYCLSKEFEHLFDYTPGEIALLQGQTELAAMLGESRSISDCRNAFDMFSIKENSPSYAKDLLSAILQRDFALLGRLLEEHGKGILYEQSYDSPSSSYRQKQDLNAFSVISRCFCLSIGDFFEQRKIAMSPQEFLQRDEKETVFFNWAMMDIHPLGQRLFNKAKEQCMKGNS